MLLELERLGGLRWGVQVELARVFEVSPSTICRDLRHLLRTWTGCHACGSLVHPDDLEDRRHGYPPRGLGFQDVVGQP